MNDVKLGIIGFGTVGSGVVEGLNLNSGTILERTGLNITVKRIVDIDITTDRGVKTGDTILSTDYREILEDDEITTVVQLIGGTAIAFDIMMELLLKGKKVVTANKALLAEKGAELFKTAKENSTSIAFEASTAGGIPIIAALRDGLAGNSIKSFYGIVNGTCNFILSQMTRNDYTYEKALAEAQEKGYAEADPTFDVEGFDSAHKLCILTATAFRTVISMDDIHVEGITKISKADINFARELGYVVKLLAIGIQRDKGIELRVHPTLLRDSHPLSAVNGSFNAICVDSNLVGETMYYGKGAGSLPTASAVIADIVDTELGLYKTKFDNLCYFKESTGISVIPFSGTVSKFYAQFSVKDEPGVLSKITSILSENSISVASMIQKETRSKTASIEMMTHECVEENFTSAMKKIEDLDFVASSPGFIRALDIESEE